MPAPAAPAPRRRAPRNGRLAAPPPRRRVVDRPAETCAPPTRELWQGQGRSEDAAERQFYIFKYWYTVIEQWRRPSHAGRARKRPPALGPLLASTYMLAHTACV